MKSLRYLLILLCLLMYSHVQAEEGRYTWGKLWQSWTDHERNAYLYGLKQGLSEGGLDIYRLFAIAKLRGFVTYGDINKELKNLSKKTLAHNFPEVEVARDVMTEFYADPSDTYLEPRVIFMMSVAKIRGAPPELIEKMLASARKEAYEWGMAVTFRKLFYEEVLNLK